MQARVACVSGTPACLARAWRDGIAGRVLVEVEEADLLQADWAGLDCKPPASPLTTLSFLIAGATVTRGQDRHEAAASLGKVSGRYSRTLQLYPALATWVLGYLDTDSLHLGTARYCTCSSRVPHNAVHTTTLQGQEAHDSEWRTR